MNPIPRIPRPGSRHLNHTANSPVSISQLCFGVLLLIYLDIGHDSDHLLIDLLKQSHVVFVHRLNRLAYRSIYRIFTVSNCLVI